MSLKLIGVLGGAFDPIHYGHIKLAKAWQDVATLSKVLFIPSGLAPHKNIVLENKHRVEMLNLALNPYTNFFTDDREIKKNQSDLKPSYTIETLQSLIIEKKEDQAFCFLMGSDAFLKLESWHLWNELFNYCHILIVERRESPILVDQLTSALKKEWSERLTQNIEDLRGSSFGLIMTKKFEYIDISSSQIRDAIYSNKNLTNLLPAAVADYINLHGLYR
ncbi:nicotinate (nicotinamide) nucleotide adenylyltransferase [Candidatus Methylopumilus rimovensis]|uniref:nicotinate (nicotinamide) nucleotide adenylyltransferase n=1 Tax=Candidatus Methylopumilus rimovensis TaxID=2588535 RepID=UPI00111D1C17|nr:nicotinate (nicotinamide) nucleotide adenylyltransferase [Candidatus Methylopumilus rimovensis]QDD12501.1 nicotinate (nicotinamide) nucleotide adenylyltransferase [Candidatus Methylopumilus rimovensis]